MLIASATHILQVIHGERVCIHAAQTCNIMRKRWTDEAGCTQPAHKLKCAHLAQG